MDGLSTYTLTKLVFWLHIKTMIELKKSREIYDAVKFHAASVGWEEC